MSSPQSALVVGAGPVGLAAACELRRHGAAVRIVERSAWPGVRSRAILVDTRTLEIFERIGVLDDALSTGHRLYGVSLYDDGRRVSFVSFEDPDAPFPFVLSLPQSATEALLEHALGRFGAHVERGVECVNVRAGSDHVDVELRRPGESTPSNERVGWLLACDGAHSTVREVAGGEFGREEQELAFAIVDVRGAWNIARDEMHAFVSTDGVVVAVPLPGDDRWRLVLDLAHVASPDDGPNATSTVSAGPPISTARMLDLLASRAHVAPGAFDVEWSAAYRVRPRVLRRYSNGRVFFVGDAAHVFSPASNQGMNVGIQDAHNLAWKIALVQRGLARDGVLASYQPERQSIALGVLDPRTYPLDLLPLRSPVSDPVRRHVAAMLAPLDVMQRRLSRHSPWHAASYRASPSVLDHRSARDTGSDGRPSSSESSLPASALHAGDRAVDAFVAGPTGELRRLSTANHQTLHTALLFSGVRPGTADIELLRRTDARLHARVPSKLKTCVVVTPEAARHLDAWHGEVLMDPDLEAHRRYAAGAPAACVVRPDGYLGLCSRPLQLDAIEKWIDLVFT